MMAWMLGLILATGLRRPRRAAWARQEAPAAAGNVLPPLPEATQEGTSGREPRPTPPPPAVAPGVESESRRLMTPPPTGRPYDAESSARELQPGVGDFYIPPPPIPPVPPSMNATVDAEARATRASR